MSQGALHNATIMKERNDTSGKRKPNLTRKDLKGRTCHQVVIGDCDSADEAWSVLQEIEMCWKNHVPRIELEFRELNEMRPNSALLFHEFLRRKPPGTLHVAKAFSSIIGPGVLVWAEADLRYIRPTGWLFFRRAYPGRRPRTRPPWQDEGDWWKAPEAAATPDFGEMDYRTVLRLLNQHLPVESLAGQVLTPALLDEFNLLDPGLKNGLGPDEMAQTETPEGEPLAEKRVWYLTQRENGRFTLTGGWTLSKMAKHPELRLTDLGLDFATKEELLGHLDSIEFCLEGDKLIMDGVQVVRG